MNFRLVSKLLGIVALLIGGAMTFSLPWAHPALGKRGHLDSAPVDFEASGFAALAVSMLICFVVGGALLRLGKGASGQLFRKEAMAVVGLSWVMATMLGALPYIFSGCETAGAQGETAAVKMSIVDALFESQSGFSTTGATVITDLEQPGVPHCILFWRSSTHFLGGLGIIVLFVAILGHGSSGKLLMRAETTGPTKDGSYSRTQQNALFFAAIYVGLTVILTILLALAGMSVFDSLCHAFGTMATGGFSTYNASLGHFNSPLINYLVIGFMVLAGTNFMLLAFLVMRRPGRLLSDTEWRAYLGTIIVSTALITAVGLYHGSFASTSQAVEHSLFQVVSMITTTGFGTHDYDRWNDFGRALLLVLMFVGGCAGSTGGGMKVIRIVLFFKILRLEIEQAYHPSVVRPLRLGGKPLDDQRLRQSILLYCGLITALFVCSWLFVITFERTAIWGDQAEHKLIDSASAVAATLNNIGPGLGIVGPTRNYAQFSWYTKLLFVWLMMLGRVEIFSVIVLCLPGFWKAR